jgi:hypothetical protein
MKITEDVRKYAAEKGVAEQEALGRRERHGFFSISRSRRNSPTRALILILAFAHHG